MRKTKSRNQRRVVTGFRKKILLRVIEFCGLGKTLDEFVQAFTSEGTPPCRGVKIARVIKPEPLPQCNGFQLHIQGMRVVLGGLFAGTLNLLLGGRGDNRTLFVVNLVLHALLYQGARLLVITKDRERFLLLMTIGYVFRTRPIADRIFLSDFDPGREMTPDLARRRQMFEAARSEMERLFEGRLRFFDLSDTLLAGKGYEFQYRVASVSFSCGGLSGIIIDELVDFAAWRSGGKSIRGRGIYSLFETMRFLRALSQGVHDGRGMPVFLTHFVHLNAVKFAMKNSRFSDESISAECKEVVAMCASVTTTLGFDPDREKPGSHPQALIQVFKSESGAICTQGFLACCSPQDGIFCGEDEFEQQKSFDLDLDALGLGALQSPGAIVERRRQLDPVTSRIIKIIQARSSKAEAQGEAHA